MVYCGWQCGPGGQDCGPKALAGQGHRLPMVAGDAGPDYHTGEAVDGVEVVHAGDVVPPHGRHLVEARADSPLHLHCISVNTRNKYRNVISV